jgi:hypothetical protein
VARSGCRHRLRSFPRPKPGCRPGPRRPDSSVRRRTPARPDAHPSPRRASHPAALPASPRRHRRLRDRPRRARRSAGSPSPGTRRSARRRCGCCARSQSRTPSPSCRRPRSTGYRRASGLADHRARVAASPPSRTSRPSTCHCGNRRGCSAGSAAARGSPAGYRGCCSTSARARRRCSCVPRASPGRCSLAASRSAAPDRGW